MEFFSVVELVDKYCCNLLKYAHTRKTSTTNPVILADILVLSPTQLDTIGTPFTAVASLSWDGKGQLKDYN